MSKIKANLPNGSSVAGGLTAIICAKKAIGYGVGAVVSLLTGSPLIAIGLAVATVAFAFFAKEAVLVAKKIASGEGEKSFKQFFKEYITSIMKTVENIFEAIASKVKSTSQEILNKSPNLNNVIDEAGTVVTNIQSNLYPNSEDYN